MTKWVNNDWETAGVRSVNLGRQPGVCDVELPDDHEALRNITGHVSPEEQANRDMNSSLAQIIFIELGTSQADKERVREKLEARYSGINMAKKARL